MRRLRWVARYGPWSAWLLLGALCGCTHGSTITNGVASSENATNLTGTELLDQEPVEAVAESLMAPEADQSAQSQAVKEVEPEKAPPPVTEAALAPVAEAKPVVAATLPAVEVGGSGFQSGAAGMPMGPGLPEAGVLMVYVVRPQDTLSLVAKRIYGSVGKWKELAAFSHLQNPNLIFPGDILYYPLTEKTQKFAQTQMIPDDHHVVMVTHTTLPNISKEVYGESKYWKMIWRENGQIQNPFHVKKGEVVYYPAKSLLVMIEKVVAQQPETQTTTDTENTTENSETPNSTQTGVK